MNAQYDPDDLAAPTAQYPVLDGPPPFGCVIPGCAPVLVFNEIEPASRWMASLGYAAESVVVFLTGVFPLPEEQGLGVYISRADDGDFTYLGYLTNERPSALFHVPSSFIEVHRGVEVVLGVTLEPLDVFQNLGVSASVAEQQRAATHFHIAQKIANDLERYLLSYAKTVPAHAGGAEDGDTVMLPASWLVHWRQRLETKMQKDLAFWSGEE